MGCAALAVFRRSAQRPSPPRPLIFGLAIVRRGQWRWEKKGLSGPRLAVAVLLSQLGIVVMWVAKLDVFTGLTKQVLQFSVSWIVEVAEIDFPLCFAYGYC